MEVTKHPDGLPDLPPTPVFRGQANSSYDVTPSLYRATTNQKLEKKKLEFFTLLMKCPEIENSVGVPLSKYDIKATAQHFQASLTDFVDMTGACCGHPFRQFHYITQQPRPIGRIHV
ncbi:FRG domain-containing protein [Pseudomonas brassicacearum]|uniref:FRG domain-containing protein n=1 Tax=Pseudomonas brassicacearum TaxID=930166 RepID=UPI00385786EF